MRRFNYILIVTLLACLSLSGCLPLKFLFYPEVPLASDDRARVARGFESNPEKAKVYLTNDSHRTMFETFVFLDNQRVAPLIHNSFFFLELEQGTHRFTLGRLADIFEERLYPAESLVEVVSPRGNPSKYIQSSSFQFVVNKKDVIYVSLKWQNINDKLVFELLDPEEGKKLVRKSPMIDLDALPSYYQEIDDIH